MDIAPARSRLPTCPLSLTINGTPYNLDVHPWTTLLDLLRSGLELTGTKKGCDHGQCGACTVLIDGERMNSCLKLALTLDGTVVTTIEGLGTPDRMHPPQHAFVARRLPMRLAADLPADEAAFLGRFQVFAIKSVFAAKVDAPAWRSKKSWAIVATEDRAINPDLQRDMAKRAGSAVTPCGLRLTG